MLSRTRLAREQARARVGAAAARVTTAIVRGLLVQVDVVAAFAVAHDRSPRDRVIRGLPSATVRAALVVAAFGLLISSCKPASTLPLRAPDGKPPNVVLITIDTLRADHLGTYGYALPTSPAIDALAAKGVTFDRCMASAPETAPAAASILTGNYQGRHRVFRNLAKLADENVTLAERLHAAGYATAGFSGNMLLGAPYGFAQGFDAFTSFAVPKALHSSDDRGAALAVEWLESRPPEPWFLWIHFMDPHGPYTSAPASMSADFDYAPGTFGADEPVPVGTSNFGLGIIPRYQRIGGLDRLSQYVRRYDGEIRFTDMQVGKVVDALHRLDHGDDTLIVLTADHGESLTEHREYLQHGWYLYDTTLHVPLVFSWQGSTRNGARIPQQMSSVDIVPTILELAGADTRGLEIDGESLAAAVAGEVPAEEVPIFAAGPRANRPSAVVEGRWKLIHTPPGTPHVPSARSNEEEFAAGARWELYDRNADPGETHDLSRGDHDEMERLRWHIENFELTFYETPTEVTKQPPSSSLPSQ
jgi:arylsulfatase A-like enzyme